MKYIIGSDEVGTGACAGPFCVCAVRVPENWNLEGLNDSKKLSPKKRETINQKLINLFHIGEIDYILIEVSNVNIDIQGLGVALKNAHKEAINILADQSATAIVDGNLKINADCPTTSMVKADQSIPAVMAASILAKSYRDFLMKTLDESHPEYNWKSNVGYATPEHKELIKKYGYSPYHRQSFKLNINK
jgi:ribonuclease HII